MPRSVHVPRKDAKMDFIITTIIITTIINTILTMTVIITIIVIAIIIIITMYLQAGQASRHGSKESEGSLQELLGR